MNCLLNLIRRKPLSQITDREIIKQAHVSSKTFYRYWQNKTELTQEVENGYLKDFKRALKADRQLLLKNHPTTKNAHYVIDFFAANQTALKALLSKNNEARFLLELRRIGLGEYTFLMKFKNGYHYDMKPGSSHYFSGQVFVSLMLTALLTWLQNSNIIPKEKIIAFFERNYNNPLLKKQLSLRDNPKNKI